jgi:hypothetical protein
MRLVREALANEESAGSRALDVDSIAEMDDEDKTYAAMGVAKTISTVGRPCPDGRVCGN